jgi:anti-sigma factor NepR-like protein
MHMDAQTRKAGGRLSREDQRRLGDILQRVYDDVLRQGVPDRFKDLLHELDERKEVTMPSANGQAEEGQRPETDRLVEAKGFPYNKGSS